MTTQSYVLVLKIGPVQGFIAQARRTRDLWFGSYLLSSLSRAMACALRDAGAELIFPHPEQLDAAVPKPSGRVTKTDQALADAESVKGFPNKVLAVVKGDAAEVARAAREAARATLRAQWKRVRATCGPLLTDGADAWADEQLDTFLEFHAAWAPMGDGEYPVALEEAEAALEARRGLREFRAWTQAPPAGTHKSSLDGGRASVLKRERPRSGEWKRLRIGEREELDALGLLKRAGGEPDQFVPVPSIGLAAWLDTASKSKDAGPELSALRGACADHRGFTSVHRTDLAWVNAFPFDGQLLLSERWRPYFAEWSEDPKEAKQEAERFADKHIRPLLDAMPVAPYPYVACLVADGDRMGELLRGLAEHGGIEAHRRVSHALASFTEEARDIVQSRYRGMLVYAGGDDVLAFVCPADALECARALAAAFSKHLAPVSGEAVPTLSVGLGIGHVMESLGQLLSLGRRAEKAAKDAGRDALAVLVAKHAGRERLWTASWTPKGAAAEPLTRLSQDMALLGGDRLPLGKVHEVETMVRRFPAETASEEQAGVLVAEVSRILARAEGRARGSEARERKDKALSLTDVGLAALAEEPPECVEKVHAELLSWVDRMLVAGTLERSRRGLELKKEVAHE
ncbi:type III-B CRISPR-associated protein Cas10/Cmr2 [Myxococcus sp. K38C18041901]|uniref:type III-B CRISPR-associated protein Cas10/Cmr2 n=1 Tax=Myxococcus guangdongensis TaxID=2906760 RepID=UPI0020A7EA6E|nr:type III-B CRISPR-associated protein Cas10/Cmr2 [Myxococcus guangdongensis]MCP3062642.1 type III-B CRISPR-associated protein Cas10/Cmr2 [Myxococcus guangdongensis]